MFRGLHRFAFILPLIAICFDLSAARAGGVELPHIDVEKIKTTCEEGSQPFWDTGVTSARMQGSMEYRECLKSAIIAYWKQLGPERSQAEFAKNLGDFTNPFIEIVNDIFLSNKACPCGTLYNDYYSLFTASVYELLLKGMAEASGAN